MQKQPPWKKKQIGSAIFALKNTIKLRKLAIDFYNRHDVVQIAKELVGKIVVTAINGAVTSARIVETEAYAGIVDRASHAYAGKRTVRNEHMYAPPGTAYVYICYGIHQMFNIVTNKSGVPDAILIRAVEPMQGIDTMLERSGKPRLNNTLTKGPGNLCRAMGICKAHSGADLSGDIIFLGEDHFPLEQVAIGVSKRIGINYAGADAELPYRFYLKGNRYVSGRPTS